MFLPRYLSRRQNIVIYEYVMNSKAISTLFKLGKLCSTLKIIHSYW